MISSMTGFARRSSGTPWGEVQWEMRSLNHRSLDIAMQIPEEFRVLEARCRRAIASRFDRGRIDAGFKFRRGAESEVRQELNLSAVQSLAAQAEKVQNNVSGISPMTVTEILRWPGVLATTSLDDSELYEQVYNLLEQTICDLDVDRRREGDSILGLLNTKIKELREFEDKAQTLIPLSKEDVRKRLTEKIEEISSKFEKTRIEQEIAVVLLRMDTGEEIERIGLHLSELEHVLAKEKSAGKRLGFIVQELSREINTLSSKSSYYPLNSLMVDMKVVVEQIREQIQNIA